MISLVITIIVLIILSSIAFFASNDTIANATYSTYVSNVAEVASAFEKTALDMNSEEELIKDPKLDEQIYNYVARGGENLEFLEYEELPYYTLMSEEVSIGMDLPSMKVESGTGHVIPIKYASTLQGKIFTWPPYEHEGKLYITQEDTVEHKMQEQITVGGERLTIVIDSGDGSLLEAPSGEGYYEPDWGEDLPFESTPPDEDPDQEAHLFTSKTPTPEYLVSEATCTTPAIYYYKCISCDLKGTTTYTYEKALGHQWDTYKITKVATCNESGTKQRECLRCKDVETVVIAKDTKNHVGSEVEEVTRVASCTETERKTTKCSACNVVLKVQEGNKNPDNHTGGESTQVTKPATCTENGTKVTSCVGCNKVLKTEAIPAFGHSFGNFVEVKEPTCSVKGVKQKTCTTCGTTENEEIPLDANNHKGSTAGEERIEPTCTENGKIIKKCSLCGGTLSTETILYLGHKYNSVVTEPTQEAGGYTTHTCERCGDTYQDNFTEKLQPEAYAIYSETDKSLRFYKNADKVNVGDTYKNLKVTDMYTGIETSTYTSKDLVPWLNHSGDILKAVVEDEITPISTARWFYAQTNLASVDLEKLDTSKVTTMEAMFYAAIKLKTIDLRNFDTTSLEDMDAMFSSYSTYGDMSLTSLDLSHFDTSKVTSMEQVFQRCRDLKTLNLTGWDTKKVTNMRYMFTQVGYNSESLEILGLSGFDTSSVTDMSNMFYSVGYNAKTWNIGDLSNWDTSSVTTMEYAFAYAGNNVDAFTLDLSNWDTSSVTDMGYMFYATGENSTTWNIGDLSDWDTSKVKFLDCVFAYAGKTTTSWSVGDLSNWNTSSALNMTSMFAQAGMNATTFNLGNLDNWDTSKVINMSNLFSNAGKNSSTWNVGDLSKWNTSNVTNMYQMFGYTGLKASTFDIGDLSTKTVTKADGTTYTAWDTSKVTNMAGMFTWGGYGASIFDIGNIGTWDVSSVTKMNYMFNQAGCYATTWNIGDLSNWNTKSVTSLYGTFHMAGYNATTFDIGDLSTKLVTKANGTTYTAWDVSKVTTMYRLFGSAGRVASEFNLGDIGTWNISNLKEMQYMFAGAGQQATSFYVGNLGDLNTSNVTNMLGVFENAGRNSAPITLDLSNWNTSKVTYAVNESGEITSGMNDMFTGMRRLHTITLGSNFSTTGDGTCTFSLPTIDTSYFTNSDGKWYDVATGIGYEPNAIPTNTAATYSVELPIEAYAIYSETDNSLRFYKNADKPQKGERYRELFVTEIYTGFEETIYSTKWDSISNETVSTTPWFEYAENIEQIIVEEKIVPQDSIAYWFYKLKNVKNLDLSKLDTTKVFEMSGTFCETGYNANTFLISGLQNWNTSSVTYMTNMFSGAGYKADNFIIDSLTNWDVSNVVNMKSLFSSAGYNAKVWEIGDLTNWNTKNVKNIYEIFYRAGYNAITWNIGDLSEWNVEKIDTATSAFAYSGYTSKEWNIGKLDKWETTSLKYVSKMFECAGYNSEEIDLDLSDWNVSNINQMDFVFESFGYKANKFNLGNLDNWDTSNMITMINTFKNAGACATDSNIGDLSNWNTSKMSNMSSLFFGIGQNDKNFSLGNLSTKTVTKQDGTTYLAWSVSNVTDISSMFNNIKMSKLDLSNWDTAKVTNMSYIFQNCSNLVSFNGGKELLGDVNRNGIVDLADAEKCMELWVNNSATAEDIRIADINGDGEINMTDSNIIANYISSANTTYIKSPLNFVTTSVTNMSSMFEGCSSLEALDLTTFNTSAVTNMDNMFKGCINLEVVNLGPNFAFKSTSGYLPAQTSDNVENADGNWYNMETMVGYAPSAIPNNTAASYTSIINGTKIPVDGLGDVITNDPDIELEYDPDDGTLGGAVPPSEDEPEEPAEMPEDKKPEIIEVGFGNFEPVTTYTPGTYKEVPYEQSFTKTKYPVSYLTVTWSEWTITKDADGNVISTTAGDMQLEDIDKVYSTWIVYDMETEKYLESNGVKGDSMEIWAPFIAEEDSLENMVYLAAYLNKIDGKTSRHIAKHDGTKYVTYNADAMISGVTCFTETYTVTGTKTVEVTKPSSSTEYVYVPIGTIRAEKDMTWETWLNSSYNTTGNKTPTIKTSDYVDVAYTDVIDENLDYGFIVYELDGIWKWNDTILIDPEIYDGYEFGTYYIRQYINFTTFDGSYNLISVDWDSYSNGDGNISHTIVYQKRETPAIYPANDDVWSDEQYKIIDFGSIPQEVSKRFYEFFTANAQEQMEVLRGVYIWNDEINLDVDEVYAEEVNYTSNGQQYTWLHTPNESRLTPNGTITESYAIHYGDNGNYMQSAIEGGIDVSGIGPMSWSIQSDLGIANPGNDIYVWLDDAYKIIDFGSPQIVSKNFYDWFLENAKPTLSGIYEWNDSISYPDSEVFGMFEEYMDFSSNGATYPLLQVEWYEMEKYISYYNGSSASVIAHNSSSGWNEENYKTIDFGSTPQAVSKEFYEWFNANASPMSFEAVNGTTWEFAPTKLINNESDATYALKLSISKDSTKVLQNVEANLHIHSGTGGGLLLLADGENITIKYIDFAATKYILTIHGGEDAENPDLIEWLLSNATLVGVHKTCSYGDYVVTTAATCTTDGVKTKTCTECGSTETEVIRATGHNYESVVTAPTLESQGYTTHTCSKCGDSYKDSYTDKLVAKAFAIYSQTDGSLRFYNNADTPTVGSTYKERAVTSVYTGFETEEYSSSNLPPWHYDIISSVVVEEVVSPISTAYWFYLSNVEDYDLTNLDTSNVTSMSYMFVEDDNKYIGSPYSIVGMDNWDTSKVIDMSYMFDTTGVNSPTYNIGDLSGWDTSSVENMSHMFASSGPDASTWDVGDLSGWDTSKVTNFEAMFFNAGTSSSGITLDLSGWNTTKATNMTNMFYEARRVSEIKLGSNFSTNGNGTVTDFAFPTIDTTYFTNSDGKWYNASTKVGYEPNAIPTNTAATYTVEVQDPCAAGHTYGDWTTTTAATCSTAGSKYRTCTVCGNEETTTIAATGHSYSSTYLSDATNHWQKCENCSSTTNTGAHSYGSWTTTKAATCSTAGSKYRTCGTCGYKQTQTIEKTGHDYSVSSSTAGDCNTASTTTYKCDNCGNTYTSTGSYGSHSYSVSSSTAGDCNTASTTTYRCSECGNTYTSTGGYGSHNYENTCSTALTNAGCSHKTCSECGATTGSHIDPCTH